MGILISKEDFEEGQTSISTNSFTLAEVDLAIDTYEKTLLIELLGIELFNLFDADLDAMVPQSPIYLEIYNSFFKEINNKLVESKGMKQMLVKWVWFYYVRQQSQSNSIAGNVQSDSTASSPSRMSYATLMKEYNECIETFCAIQTYINSVKDASYPAFKGVRKQFMSWA